MGGDGGVPIRAGSPDPGVGVTKATGVPPGATTSSPGGVAVAGTVSLTLTSLLTVTQLPSRSVSRVKR